MRGLRKAREILGWMGGCERHYGIGFDLAAQIFGI